MINHPFLNIEGNHRSGADPYPQVKLLLSSTYSLKEKNTRRPIKQKRHPRSSTRLDASIYIHIYICIHLWLMSAHCRCIQMCDTFKRQRLDAHRTNLTIPYHTLTPALASPGASEFVAPPEAVWVWALGCLNCWERPQDHRRFPPIPHIPHPIRHSFAHYFTAGAVHHAQVGSIQVFRASSTSAVFPTPGGPRRHT